MKIWNYKPHENLLVEFKSILEEHLTISPNQFLLWLAMSPSEQTPCFLATCYAASTRLFDQNDTVNQEVMQTLAGSTIKEPTQGELIDPLYVE